MGGDPLNLTPSFVAGACAARRVEARGAGNTVVVEAVLPADADVEE